MSTSKKNGLLLIGESLHILNRDFQESVQQQNQASLVQLAQQQIRGGAMALDINLGPARSMADRLPWVVRTIQEQHPVPLFLPAACSHLDQALEIHQGRATINAVTAEPSQLAQTMRTARTFDADLVVLLTKPGLNSFGIQQRLQIALEVLEQADAIGLPLHQLYLDPLFSVRTDPVSWNLCHGMPDLEPVLQTLSLIGELSNRQPQTILALSNGTQGIPRQKRSLLHCRMLPLLVDAGLDAVLVNCRDRQLMDLARSLVRTSGRQQKAA